MERQNKNDILKNSQLNSWLISIYKHKFCFYSWSDCLGKKSLTLEQHGFILHSFIITTCSMLSKAEGSAGEVDFWDMNWSDKV